MARMTWREKFERDTPPEVKAAPKDFADIKAGQRMLLTTPKQLDAFIRTIPSGTSLNMKSLRAQLAEQEGAEIACPVVTGIHLRTVAEVVNIDLEAGTDPADVTPVWRAIEPGAPLTNRLESGPERFMHLRREEGLPG